jgi:hypothetical protein
MTLDESRKTGRWHELAPMPGAMGRVPFATVVGCPTTPAIRMAQLISRNGPNCASAVSRWLLARRLHLPATMSAHASTDQLARLDDEIVHLEHRTTAASAGLAEHIVLEAARRMRMTIASELAARQNAANARSAR